ncbi:Transposon Tf2-6 polyprotein [Anabarilius grahami]|uniref:Gypsy retrotransposon integrase-like protein 1 n=1 Tax=Anabarilius grahami TaxID=495550 RepID=A0A3N0Y9B7_ANAGA|nr:Transposon Tf2-6 polyprotein [Anabarilius grahami]
MSHRDPFQELVDALRRALTPQPPTPSPPVASATPASTPSPVVHASPMAKPAPYSGSAEDCSGFLLQCELGKAFQWADSLWTQKGPAVQSYSSFVSHFREVFGKPVSDSFAGEKLYNLKQRSMSVNEYALQFRTLAAASGWNEQALITSYRQGLEPSVRLHLAAYEDSIGLERVIQLSIRVGSRMQSCIEEHQGQPLFNILLRQSEPVSPPEPASEPMQVDSSRLSSAERQRRLTLNLCLYCGAPGHVRSACPIRPPRPMVSSIIPSIKKMKPLTTVVNLTAADISIPVVALLDSGSAGNLISGSLCRQLQLKTTPSLTIYQVHSITDKPLSRRKVSRCLHTGHGSVPSICYRVSQCPGEEYTPSVPEEKAMEDYIKEALNQGYIRPSTSPAASSFFFVAKKDGGLRPSIDYRALNKITLKFRYPLPLDPAALEHLRGATVFTKLDLRSAYNLIRIREGDDWKTAFVTLTGHYEYLIMPYGLVNAPSVFQDFIHEVLREFLPRFVLVYIDDILIYSRSLAEHRHHVAEVLQCLRQFHLFLKAEKFSFHQPSVHFLGYIIDHSGIRMDEGKVEAIKSWPTPSTIKELQRFLGFANFYRRFIKNYSSIVHPLTNLLRNQPKSLSWDQTATNAFEALKNAFTTAPLLVHPNPELPFVVEVDASTTGVGAVLSQKQGTPSRLHPCAFFSRKLNPAEVNYDIGDRELLAVKLALEEWRHWLEGAKHSFLVLTDHKNLEYLKAAKRLNPRQARWAMFFSRFDFSISYRPGSKNVKADALSRLHAPVEKDEEPETVLPESIFVNPISWLEETLPSSNASSNAPPGCPQSLQYITRTRRTPLIHSAHNSLGTGHPGVNETLSLLKEHFWWPNMANDVRRYVQGCRECAISKSPRHLPAGKLNPLPVPERPWSHLGVDFITDLPASDGHT